MKDEPAFQPWDSAVASSTTTCPPPTSKEPSSTLRSVSPPMVEPVTPVRYSVVPSIRPGALRIGLVAVTPSVAFSFSSMSAESSLPFAIDTT